MIGWGSRFQVSAIGYQVQLRRFGCRCGYIHPALDSVLYAVTDSVLGASRLCHSMTTNPLDRMYKYSSMSGL